MEREIVLECLEIALQAPTGSNRQGWQWVFVDDQTKKDELGRIYRENFAAYRTRARAQYADDDPRAGRADKVLDSADYLAQHMHEAPLLMIPCIEGKPTGGGASFWGSLHPAVWSMMLALRERGLGSAWTSLHLPNGGEEAAAALLGIPFEQYSQGGLVPIAYTKGTDFKPATRLPAEQLTHWNEW